MPANLTAQFRAAEAELRAARTAEERRAALETMLREIPKHKGTEKMQADIKRRLARLRQEAERRAAPRVHTVHVEAEGAAQVVLLGPPNGGRSSLLATLTRAEPAIAEYPFTTTRPQPGMMPWEDVHIQLVDLPPVTREHMDPWMPNVIQTADAALLVADAGARTFPGGLEEVRERLAEVHIHLVRHLSQDPDPRDTELETLLVLTHADSAPPEDLEVAEELFAEELDVVRFDAARRTGVQALKSALWRMLGLVRVYTKPPGKKADRSEPVVLPAGSTVLDLAGRIHRELPERLSYARLWGGKVDGQRVAQDFELRDRDVVELGT